MAKLNFIIHFLTEKISLLIIAFSLFSCQKENIHKEYFENGEVKFIVPLNEYGYYEGIGILFYINGDTFAQTEYSEGKKNGRSIIFSQNGHVLEEHFYHNDLKCCKWSIFDSSNKLVQTQFYNSSGQLIDYYEMDSLGNVDYDIQNKSAIIIPELDTISINDQVEFEIHLGNHQYSSVEFYIGNPYDLKLRDSDPLTNRDSISASFTFLPTKKGDTVIRGAIIEIADEKLNDTSDILIVIPFKKLIHVE